jgi:TPR repeat protein
MYNRLIFNFSFVFLLGGCTNSKINTIEDKNPNIISIPCEIANEYGTIKCGQIPISLKNEVNQKLIPNCQIDFENFNDSSKKCLEQNDKRPADAYILGNLKFYGEFYDKNEAEGLKYIEYAAEHQNPQAKFWLAKKYEADGNINSTTILIKEAANLGNPLAIHSLGARYSRGIGVDKNLDQASLLLNQSKEYIPASFSEIALIEFQKGNVEGFVKYNNIAIDKKYWFSYADLAVLYLGEMPNLEGYRDLDKVIDLSNKLIEHNVAVGYALKARVLQYKSDGVANPEICDLYKLSFDKGYLSAGLSVGSEYLLGDNCSKNYKLALTTFNSLYSESDKDIKVVAASNLGYMYLNGLGVNRDLNKSKEYLEYAKNYGFQPAVDMLKK